MIVYCKLCVRVYVCVVCVVYTYECLCAITVVALTAGELDFCFLPLLRFTFLP